MSWKQILLKSLPILLILLAELLKEDDNVKS